MVFLVKKGKSQDPKADERVEYLDNLAGRLDAGGRMTVADTMVLDLHQSCISTDQNVEVHTHSCFRAWRTQIVDVIEESEALR